MHIPSLTIYKNGPEGYSSASLYREVPIYHALLWIALPLRRQWYLHARQ